jgi:hypothetical protein
MKTRTSTLAAAFLACLALMPAINAATINTSAQFYEDWSTPSSTNPANFGWTVVNSLASPATPTVSQESYFGGTNDPMLLMRGRGTPQPVQVQRSDLNVDSAGNGTWTFSFNFRVDKSNTESFSTYIFLSQQINQNWPTAGSSPGTWYQMFGSSASTFTLRSYGPSSYSNVSTSLNTNTDYLFTSIINGATDTQFIEIRLVSDNSLVASGSFGVWGDINPANTIRSIGFISESGTLTTAGNTFIDNINLIPEPSVSLLTAIGLCFLFWRRRRMRAA